MDATSDKGPHVEQLFVKVGGLQCSFCTESINKAMTRMEGVSEVAVSLSHEEVLIHFDPRLATSSAIKNTLTSIGFTIRDPEKLRSFEEEEEELRGEKRRLLFAALLTITTAFFMFLMWAGFSTPIVPPIIFLLALLTMFGPGLYIKRMAGSSLRRGIFNQHVLLEFAAFGGLVGGLYGFFIQPWPLMDFFAVSVFVTSYHILSGYVSLLVRTRSTQAIKKLMDLQPATAWVIRSDNQDVETPIDQVMPGDLVRVRPGESIPIDGVIEKGSSTVDQSLVTGESLPVPKREGDEVIGGSLNQWGTLLIRVTKVGEESFIQQIANHIQEARVLKPSIVVLVDRVLKYFVRGVIFSALLAFAIWTLGSWVVVGQPNFERAVFATLAVLVMGYPCALGMATPLAMIRGSGMAARNGVLIRSGEAFQVFKDIRKVVFDKTGTLTKGNMQVIEIVTVGEFIKSELLMYAASLELESEHPLARAVVDRALADGVELEESTDIQIVPGMGIQGLVRNEIVLVGSPEFLMNEGIDETAFSQRLDSLRSQGLTVVAVSVAENVAGLIAVGDSLKEDVHETIDRLRAAGIEPVIVSGDNEKTVRAIAKQVSVSEIYAQSLPQDKSLIIRDIQASGYRVAMVGDGINDAPALMQADIGIAIGAGSDIAIESADVVLVGNRLGGVAVAYDIGKSSYAKTVQNVLLAFLFNFIGIPFAIIGLLHPIWAMIAMAGSVSTVLVNSFGGTFSKRVRFESP